MVTTTTIKQRGVITLPKKIRTALNLEDGQTIQIKQQDGQIIITPQVTLPKELVDAIAESKEDLKHGRYITFSSAKEMYKKLPAFRKKYAD